MHHALYVTKGFRCVTRSGVSHALYVQGPPCFQRDPNPTPSPTPNAMAHDMSLGRDNKVILNLHNGRGAQKQRYCDTKNPVYKDLSTVTCRTVT